MRFTIAREKLQEALTSVAAAVPSKTTLPVLSNLLLEAGERSVQFSGTDLDVLVSVEVPAEVDAPGALTLPAKRLGEIARELPPGPVKIAAMGEQRATLECGRARFKLLGLPRDEFPAFPAVQFNSGWRLKGSVLQDLISRTAFAVSTEESRPILNGVLWEIRPQQLRMVATNGHRLAMTDVPGELGMEATGDFILPPKALEQVRRVFPPDEEVEIGQGESHLAFRSPLASVSTRLIEGPYPNYDQVIPRDNDRVAVVDRVSLISALRRMAVVASDQTHRVKLSFNTALLRFTVQTPDVGEGQDEIPVQYAGDPLDIGFNSSYLLEILRYMPTDEVDFTFKTAERAATITPHDWAGPGSYLCLVMPLRLVD
jgi:DNA polymerase III subunit beta